MLAALGVQGWWPPSPAPAPAETALADPPPPVAPARQTPVTAVPRPDAPPQAPAPATPRSAPATPAPRVSPPPAPTPAGDPARAARIATLDWPALADAVAGCTACGLCGTRRQTVFGAGAPQADWMIVGEAPGEREDAEGQPFVGPAGQLLDAMLRAVQRTRATDAAPASAVYISNTLKCRPPGNRNPTPAELAACGPFLDRQIALVQPRLILAMGRFAVQAVLGRDEAIGRLRGRLHRRGDTPVVVTYHPSYLLRSPSEKARAWEDLCLALDALADPPGSAG